MQNILAPVTPATPAPPVESRPSPRSASPHAFASLLRQRQVAAPGPEKAAPVRPVKSDGAVDPGAVFASTRANTNAATSAADTRRSDDARLTQGAKTPRTDKRIENDDDANARGDKAETTSTADAGGAGVPLTHGLVAWHRLPATALEGGASDKAGRAARSSTASPGAAGGGQAAASASSSSTDALGPRAGAEGGRKDEGASFAQLVGSPRDAGTASQGVDASALGEATKTTTSAPVGVRVDDAMPVCMAPTADLGPASPAAPVDATLATPLTAPDFAQAFAVSVSVLVQDGVQRAELHLNPTEMGPVSVQIVVDGTQARIDFGADALATRQAIEAGLPELAGALRDAGMTLQGGGVSQHARDPNAPSRSSDGPTPSRSLGRDDDGRPATVVRQRIVAAGGLDLYA